MKHRISVPPGPGPHPVLCFLHGYDETASTSGDEGFTRHGPLWSGAPASVAERFVVIVPRLPVAGDIWHRYADAVRALVEGHGDAQRRYLTGFSFGGNGVFDLALMQPDFWAALWPVDPTRVPARDPALPIWLTFGEAARSRKPVFIRALRLGDEKRVYVDAGDDHVGAARRAYADATIYSWLLRWATSSSPRSP